MKYLINRMQCNILSQQVGWLDGKDVGPRSKGQGIKPHGVLCVVNNGMLIEYFVMKFVSLGP